MRRILKHGSPQRKRGIFYVVSVKRQARFTELFSSCACAFGACSTGCGVRKPAVFIRFDAHVVKAGMNIRGCAPLSTPGGRLRRAAAFHFLFSLAGIRVSLNIDKILHKHYNIYKYNTKGKRRSAHHPKGGVKYAGIDYCAHSCAKA